MFSDFQSFFWIAYGDTVLVSLTIMIVVAVIVTVIISLDQIFTKGGDTGL